MIDKAWGSSTISVSLLKVWNEGEVLPVLNYIEYYSFIVVYISGFALQDLRV